QEPLLVILLGLEHHKLLFGRGPGAPPLPWDPSRRGPSHPCPQLSLLPAAIFIQKLERISAVDHMTPSNQGLSPQLVGRRGAPRGGGGGGQRHGGGGMGGSQGKYRACGKGKGRTGG